MKKQIFFILVLAAAAALTACGESRSSKPAGGQAPGVSEVLEEGMAREDAAKETEKETGSETETLLSEETSAMTEDAGREGDASDGTGTGSGRQSGVSEGAPEPDQTPAAGTAASGTEGIDVDLTIQSATMVYSEVYVMLTAPESYIGKTVKMGGTFFSFTDEETGNYYSTCIIRDATACCAQGMEFVLSEDYKYPEDYPEEGEEIQVVGVFDTYKEGEYTYCTLRNARLV